MNRRHFLKAGLLGLGGLALRPFNPGSFQPGTIGLGRIAATSISIYSQPWDESRIVYTRYRDDLLNLYDEVVSDKGPAWNPIWYRVWGGYIHGKSVQVVGERLNPVETRIREGGQLAEVTVPFAASRRFTGRDAWEPLYRLYYGTVHWVVGIVEGPDGKAWYRVQEPWTKLSYDVPADTMRLIPDSELAPISAHVPAHLKRIEVSVLKQEMAAYEDDRVVFQAKVSTGLNREVPAGEIPWATPRGTWNISSKMPSQHMGNGNITSDVEAYELAGVPWVCFFHPNGNATHSTYWHNNFGNAMSHGCVNMRTQDALWLFRWTTPVWSPGSREQRGMGTRLIVD